MFSFLTKPWNSSEWGNFCIFGNFVLVFVLLRTREERHFRRIFSFRKSFSHYLRQNSGKRFRSVGFLPFLELSNPEAGTLFLVRFQFRSEGLSFSDKLEPRLKCEPTYRKPFSLKPWQHPFSRFRASTFFPTERKSIEWLALLFSFPPLLVFKVVSIDKWCLLRSRIDRCVRTVYYALRSDSMAKRNFSAFFICQICQPCFWQILPFPRLHFIFFLLSGPSR